MSRKNTSSVDTGKGDQIAYKSNQNKNPQKVSFNQKIEESEQVINARKAINLTKAKEKAKRKAKLAKAAKRKNKK